MIQAKGYLAIISFLREAYIVRKKVPNSPKVMIPNKKNKNPSYNK